MRSVKTFVQDDLKAAIVCPVCNMSRNFSAAVYKNKKRELKVRCTCKTIFLVLLEFRKYNRKRTNLKGTYKTFSQYIHREGKMLVSDISKGGLRCQVSNFDGLQQGHILSLKYVLHDIGKRTIHKRAVIRHAHGMTLGCEFLELPGMGAPIS